MSRIFNKLRDSLFPAHDVNLKRLQRRNKLLAIFTRRLTAIKILLFAIGYLWFIAIPLPQLGRHTYMDENATKAPHMNTNWNWADVHVADLYLAQLEELRDGNLTSAQRASFFKREFNKLGLLTATQSYTFHTSLGDFTGTNAYSILSAPRTSGVEAMVISASWLSRTGEGDGTLNLRGVATVLALANFLKRYSYWAKDIVFVISDDYLSGMQAWLTEYHGTSKRELTADPLRITSGVIWTALNIDYPGHSFSHLGMFHEGLNGKLPNQDLINFCVYITSSTGGVPVTLYDHIDPRREPSQSVKPSWLPQSLYDIAQVKSYLYQGKNLLRHLGYQATGRGSGVHALFHQFRIDAVTLYALPATGPHGFHALGRTMEAALRNMNNMLERLHASFFFYILTGSERFSKIGHYLPSAILISIAMMFQGLSNWVDAGWTTDLEEKEDKTSPPHWRSRLRPVLLPLMIIFLTHLLGMALFMFMSQSWFISNIKVSGPACLLIFASIPLLGLGIPPAPSKDVAPPSLILKALNLCLSSTVISIITILNFSFAMWLAILLGIPLSISSSSPSVTTRILKYFAYATLGLGWILFPSSEVQKAIWSWQVLKVWFAPFVCVVYVPLVLQAGISCLAPS